MKWYGYAFDSELRFIISFPNKADEEKGLRCCNEGVSAWVNPEDIKDEPDNFPHYTEEDIRTIECMGFCDPTEEILAEENIEYKMLTDCWDENGELLEEYKNYDITYRYDN